MCLCTSGCTARLPQRLKSTFFEHFLLLHSPFLAPRPAPFEKISILAFEAKIATPPPPLPSIHCTFCGFLEYCGSPQGVDIIVRMTEITSHPNDDVVFLQIINSVLMAYWNPHKKPDFTNIFIFPLFLIFPAQPPSQ